MPFRHILLGLFLYPRLSLLTVRLQGIWKAPLLFVIVFSFLGAIVKSALSYKKPLAEIQELSHELGSELGTLQIKDNELQWSNGGELPRSFTVNRWRVDIMGRNDQLNTLELEQSAAMKGMAVTPRGIEIWLRIPETGRIWNRHFIFSPDHLVGFMTMFGANASSPSMSPEQLDTLSTKFSPFIFLSMLCLNFPTYFQPVFLCSIIFIVLTLVFRTSRGVHFRGLLGSAICSCTPPFIIGVIYDQFSFLFLDYHTLFVIVFAIYLFLILFDRSVVIRKSDTTI